MTAFGYAFVIGGLLLLRQVVIGRTLETPADIRDLSLAFLNGDMGEVGAVLSRRGTAEEVSASGEVATISETSSALLNKCTQLGNAAKGYRLGATGPEFYDCSGLVWRAMKDLGIYNGVRFTTHVFDIVARRENWQKVSEPQTGDVVLWTARHMGIAVGGDRMYSARSTAKGIGLSSIAGDTSYFNQSPTFYRIT